MADMKPCYESLYRDMLQDIERCQQLDHPEKDNAESCFWIAKNYWDKLKEIVKLKGFKDDSEEIEFFREVKPQFTVYIEYFIILSEALQFEPSMIVASDRLYKGDTKEARQLSIVAGIVDYWELEGERYKRFCNRHSDFISYYDSGDRFKDSQYFLRANDRLVETVVLQLYDNDWEFCTYHEQILRSYLAYQRYYEFTKGRVIALTGR